MKIAVLLENTACAGGIGAAHGLSLYLETPGHKLLFDMGPNAAFAENAQAMGVDLGAVDTAVLSHGHYDHAGGFAAFFGRNDHAPLYLRPQAEEPSYQILGEKRAYLGVPEALLAQAGRLRAVTGPTQIDPGVWLLPHTTPGLERRGEKVHMYRQTAEGLRPDDFAHEQTLAVELPAGLAVFSSCSHAGADTVVREVLAAFPGKGVRAFFGGFHLMGAGGASTLGVRPERAAALGEALLELGVEEVWTGHCTGLPAFDLLRPVLGERLHYLSTGTVVEL